jgi:predicted RNA binding protein YcfA (HicA-like mRNA interferase family)
VPKVPRISGREAIGAFERAGWSVARQSSSHVVLRKSDSSYRLSIPLHDLLGVGLLRDQIAKAGLTVEEFITFLK